jgi:PEP-CTERM motif
MKNSIRFKSVAIALVVFFPAFPMMANAVPVVFSVGGDSTTASIQTTVTNFQNAVGNPNNGNNAGQLSGRREINWDGGGPPVNNNSPGPTPFTVFLNNRGALMTTPSPGTGFIQAPPTGPPDGGLATFFSNATYATIFSTFSPNRLFVPIDSNITDVTFFIPGTNGLVPATVGSFGSVFTDVDLANTTSIQFFDLAGGSLGTFFSPTGTVPSGSLSFLGVAFNQGEQIGRVRITTGNSALGPNDGAGIDVVVMDDWIYGEPRRIPEPSALLLFGFGLAGFCIAALHRFREIK